MLEHGEAFGDRRVLPPGWRDLAGQPDSAPTAFGRLQPGTAWATATNGGPAAGPTGVQAGAFVAVGAFGQYVYVHPAGQVVISRHPWAPWSRLTTRRRGEAETFALFGAGCARPACPDR